MTPGSQPAKAIAWMGLALLSFTAMVIPIRALAPDLHAFEMLFVRSAIGLVILSGLLSVRGWHLLKTQRLPGHLLRNVIHFTGQSLWIFGITLLPLATVSAIEFTTPIWGALLAVLFLGERMHRGRWVALAMGFLGILIILRPGLGPEGSGLISVGAVIMLACAFCFGATNVVTKGLTSSERSLTILFYMVAMQTLFGGIGAAFVWAPLELGHWPWLLLLAVTGLSAHLGLVRAFAAAEATFVMPFEFLRLPFVAALGFFLYAEAFELVTLLGAALIFAGNYYSLRQEGRVAEDA